VTRWSEIARASAGEDYAEQYAARFRSLADSGEDAHGEARFVDTLLGDPGSVLDAGCGTGRVAIRLASLGHHVVGVDLDASMLAVARAEAPDLAWRQGDLSDFDLGATFDVVLVAGNTVPLLEPDTLAAAARCLAAHMAPSGRLVCGFGLDEDHLPAGCPATPLADVEAAFTAAGLVEEARFGTWDRDPWTAETGYAVTVHVGS
jgi:SAM-dependent methyltransferase